MFTATYSPDDNKLRLYAGGRLPAETYARVKTAGFRWAPKQDLFVAPMWTPEREDLLLDLCDEIEDEDKSLAERAEERAERFEDYHDARAADAEHARKAVSAIADNIPFGQPILVGHHSEKHARKDAERIRTGMRRAIKMWDTAQYWTARAAGAIRHAKYKERPDVRARRIKTLEAALRKVEKTQKETAACVRLWQKVSDPAGAKKQDGTPATARDIALYVSNFDHVSRCFTLAEFPRDPPASQYEGPMGLWSALDGNVITAEQARDIAIPMHERGNTQRERWIAHYKNRLEYERAMLADAGGTAADKTGPEKGGACRCWASPGNGAGWSFIQKVNKVSVTVLDNWGNGGRTFTRTIPFDKLRALMPAEAVKAARDAGRIIEDSFGTGFFLCEETPRAIAAAAKPQACREVAAEAFDGLREALKAGVEVVVAPQLFPTPADLAARVVELAEIEPGQRVLEPSAGTGAILDAIEASGFKELVDAVEINSALTRKLAERDRVRAFCRDFLEVNGELGTFDRIVMNPPFANGADIKHIRHALTMLKPGGRLVAICANGPRQREQLKPLAAEWEDLPAETFKEAGTGVNAALLIIENRESGTDKAAAR